MKIGIITWFSGPNYGTNLQAIALQYYLRKNGHEVNIINYEIPPIKNRREKKTIFKRIIYQPEKYILRFVLKAYKNDIEKRDRKLQESINKNCILTKRINNENELIEELNLFDIVAKRN